MLFQVAQRICSLKLQELPVAFFNQNKAGDLISRLNNDTDKLNQFVSQALMQFVGSIFLMTGAAIFLLSSEHPAGSWPRCCPRWACLLFTPRHFRLDQAQEHEEPAERWAA